MKIYHLNRNALLINIKLRLCWLLYIRDETLIRDNYEIKLSRCAKETVYYKRQNDTSTVNQALHWYINY